MRLLRFLTITVIAAITVGRFSILSLVADGASQAQSGVEPTYGAYVLRINTASPVLQIFNHGKLYRIYPVALGKMDTLTPIGSWRVVDKQKDWGGGFGTRWLGLNVPWGTYGIHGTNRPTLVGKYVSSGCIRMSNHDVEQLYELIPLGTPVIITGNPLQYLRTLEYGNIGADVQLVQEKLKQAGYFRDVCDGRFDHGMQFALMFYELSRGLPMDGVVGIRDYKALGLIPRKN